MKEHVSRIMHVNSKSNMIERWQFLKISDSYPGSHHNDHVSNDHVSNGLALSQECKKPACIGVSLLSIPMALSSFKGTFKAA